MSDISQGPGWWLASDGKWYSPDLAPQAPAPAPVPSAPPYGPGPAAPPYGPPPAGPVYGYQPPGPAYGYGQQATNGLAIASLICSLFVFPSVLGVVFGFIARSQIKQSNGMQKGSGMALAGIIVGLAVIALVVIVIVVGAVAVHSCDQSTTCNLNTNG